MLNKNETSVRKNIVGVIYSRYDELHKKDNGLYVALDLYKSIGESSLNREEDYLLKFYSIYENKVSTEYWHLKEIESLIKKGYFNDLGCGYNYKII